jgi:F-type H+-transporting ATPase subunit alpha
MVLRQKQYAPLPVEEQVVQIYAATPQDGRASWVRTLPVEDVPRYAEELSEYIKSRHPEILNGIRESKDIGAHLEPKLVAALDAFAKVFQPSGGASA